MIHTQNVAATRRSLLERCYLKCHFRGFMSSTTYPFSYMVMNPLMVIVLLDLIRSLYGLRIISLDVLIISRHRKVRDNNLGYVQGYGQEVESYQGQQNYSYIEIQCFTDFGSHTKEINRNKKCIGTVSNESNISSTNKMYSILQIIVRELIFRDQKQKQIIIKNYGRDSFSP